MSSVYLFVYGSLMNYESRKQTIGHIVPTYNVYLLPNANFNCGWGFRSKKWNMTALGLYKGKTTRKIIGKILKINLIDFYNLDVREIDYDKYFINWNNIEFCHEHNIDTTKQLFTYVVSNPLFPNTNYPIKLSYVRLCITNKCNTIKN